MPSLAIRTWSHVHAGRWLVIRRHDRRVVFEAADPRECLRWVAAWGDTLGVSRAGQDLSAKVSL